jgi:putative heme-binding domain-containing protein
VRKLREFLADPDDEVRFLAAKWVADEALAEYRPLLAEALKDRRLNVRLFFAYSAALARIDGKDVNETRMADYFVERLADGHSPPEVRILALQMVPATDARLTPQLLGKLLAGDEAALQREAVRTLAEHPSGRRAAMLLEVARNPRFTDGVRAQAIAGLAEGAQERLDDLLRFVGDDNIVLRDEALRALVGTKLDERQRAGLENLGKARPQAAALVNRVLGKPFVQGRPAARDLPAWLSRLEGPADADAGRRVFFHPRLAGCFRCHQAEGRGAVVGPDLSTIGRVERRRIVESILQPSNDIAPHYQVWQIDTADGRSHTGMLVKTELDEYTYLDSKGALFTLKTTNVVESRPLATSIMPEGLADLLTDQELRDLVAYLCARR